MLPCNPGVGLRYGPTRVSKPMHCCAQLCVLRPPVCMYVCMSVSHPHTLYHINVASRDEACRVKDGPVPGRTGNAAGRSKDARDRASFVESMDVFHCFNSEILPHFHNLQVIKYTRPGNCKSTILTPPTVQFLPLSAETCIKIGRC